MKLWLDDEEIRVPPDPHWLVVRSALEAIEALAGGKVTFASLDHDLGDEEPHNTGGYVVLWMAEHDVWPCDGIRIHSWNAPRADYMRKLVDRYGPYEAPCIAVPYQFSF